MRTTCHDERQDACYSVGAGLQNRKGTALASVLYARMLLCSTEIKPYVLLPFSISYLEKLGCVYAVCE